MLRMRAHSHSKSARYNWKRVLVAFVMLLLALGIASLDKGTLPRQNAINGNKLSANMPSSAVVSGSQRTNGTKSRAPQGPVVVRAARSDTSIPLRQMRPVPPTGGHKERDEGNPTLRKAGAGTHNTVDTVVQRVFGPFAMPGPLLTFDGTADADNGFFGAGAPSDTNGEIGPNHYVQMTNSIFEVFSKNGTSLYGPVDNSTLWQGFGGDCEIHNDGDPVVVYDQIADRWLLSQFTYSIIGPYYECVAVSTTGDPTGSYHRYAFETGTTIFEDYPHFGVWPDAYYMSANEFDGDTFYGQGAFAFDRAKMLVGDPTASFIYFHKDPPDGGELPADLDGTTLPPPGSPNYFIEFQDDGGDPPAPFDALWIFKFHADFVNPANSTFTGPTMLNTAPFNSIMCGGSRDCIPSVGGDNLDAISDRLMFRLAYRNFGDHEAIVANHTVNTDGNNHAGIRWYELRGLNGTPSIFQQGTYAPDATHRWMGSIAQDRDGDIAIGYSASSAATFPGIRYSARLAGDPLGQLAQGEATMFDGTGSQVSSGNRWGDYSDLTVDPTDDCTFWFTTEYYQTTGSFDWKTRIGSFRLPSCGHTTPTPTVTGTPPTATRTPTVTPTGTNTPTATPTCGVQVMSTDVPKTLPDVTTVTSTLNIANGPTIGSVRVVGLSIDHTYPSDLSVYLISPQGTRVELFDFICGSDDWTQANTGFTLSDSASADIGSTCPPGQASYRPASPLSALAGQSSSGTWTLEVTDTAYLDEGTLYGWGVSIASASPCTSTATPTRTSTPTSTFTSTPVRTNTPTSTRTVTGTSTSSTTSTATTTSTRTSTPTGTPTRTNTPIVTGTSTATRTSTLTATSTSTVTRTNTPTFTLTPTTTATATQQPGLLVGHIIWQGPPAQPSVRQQLPITLTLCIGGTPSTFGATTDSSGFFTVTISLPTASYNWQAKGPRYLGTAGTALVTAGATTQVEMGTQRAGDVDATHNNVVNVADFNIMKGVFGQASVVGDLNNDGVTNVTDFNLLKGNFGMAGSSLSCP